jgi:hypothetical protein
VQSKTPVDGSQYVPCNQPDTPRECHPCVAAAVNKNANSHLVTVPPGAVLADVLLGTPIFMDQDAMGGGGTGFAAAAAAGASHAAMQGFDGRVGTISPRYFAVKTPVDDSP